METQTSQVAKGEYVCVRAGVTVFLQMTKKRNTKYGRTKNVPFFKSYFHFLENLYLPPPKKKKKIIIIIQKDF